MTLPGVESGAFVAHGLIGVERGRRISELMPVIVPGHCYRFRSPSSTFPYGNVDIRAGQTRSSTIFVFGRVDVASCAGKFADVVQHTPIVRRRTARAILIDNHRRLLLIKRTKPGMPPYWTTPGGGVEDEDTSLEAALRRELAEEVGAEITDVSRVLLHSEPTNEGLVIQHYFVARLVNRNVLARTGPEFDDPSRGTYEIDHIDFGNDDLALIELKPAVVKEFIMTNRQALLIEAGIVT